VSRLTQEECTAYNKHEQRTEIAKSGESKGMLSLMEEKINANLDKIMTASDRRAALLDVTREIGFSTTMQSDTNIADVGKLTGTFTVSDSIWPKEISIRESFIQRNVAFKISKLEEQLSAAQTAIKMLIEEYGKLSEKLDERDAEHAMLVSEVYKLKKGAENGSASRI
jgi:hypothetical protein